MLAGSLWQNRLNGKQGAVLRAKQRSLLFISEVIYAISENIQTRKSQKYNQSLAYNKCSALAKLRWLNGMIRSDHSSPVVGGMNCRGKRGMVEVLNILGVGSDTLNNVCLVLDRQRP